MKNPNKKDVLRKGICGGCAIVWHSPNLQTGQWHKDCRSSPKGKFTVVYK